MLYIVGSSHFDLQPKYCFHTDEAQNQLLSPHTFQEILNFAFLPFSRNNS